METSILEIVGKVAGIGGVSLGVFLLLFKDLIRRLAFPKLSREQSLHVIRLILWLTFSISFIGIVAWLIGLYLLRTSGRNETPPLPNYKLSTTFDEILIKLPIENLGGPAFGVDNGFTSALEYHVPGTWFTQNEPGFVHIVTEVGSDSGSLVIFREAFDAMNEEFCNYLRETNVSAPQSELILAINLFQKYEDALGQHHRRSWEIKMKGKCPSSAGQQVIVRDTSANNFPALSTTCKTPLPEDATARRQVMLDVLHQRNSCTN